MRYFEDNQWTYPVLGASAALAGVLLKKKISGKSGEIRGMAMPVTSPKKFFKGVKSYKELEALEKQKDKALDSLVEVSRAEKAMTLKNPIRTTKNLVDKAKSAKKELDRLDHMAATQKNKHAVDDLSEFGQNLRGGVGALGAATSGAVGGYIVYNKNK